jgi:hypothetical protein
MYLGYHYWMLNIHAIQCMHCALLFIYLQNSKMYKKTVPDTKCSPFLYNVWIINFNENLFSSSQVVSCGHADAGSKLYRHHTGLWTHQIPEEVDWPN